MRLVLVLSCALGACAQGQRPPDGAMPAPDDLSPPPPDLADGGPPDLKAVDLAGVDLAGTGCIDQVKVNEVQTAGSVANDEWIELFNACTSPVNLSGSKLVYRSATNSTPNDTSTIAPLTGTLAAGGYYLVANAGFGGAADIKPFAAGATGLAPTGGAVGLRNALGTLVDSVGWGSANNPLVEGAASTAPNGGQSVARRPNGKDTNNNSVDLTPGATTPKAMN